jgi:hypothetical protein
MKKQRKAFPQIIGDAPLIMSTVLLNRYTTTYRAVYEPAPNKQVVVDIDEQTWLQLTQTDIEKHAEGKVRAAR